jgi:leader peptidase (prepilin peptidase)/N-methyltransferase
MAIWGYIIGFLCLWIVYYLFKLITGKEGMGYGDFKLLAAMALDTAGQSESPT